MTQPINPPIHPPTCTLTHSWGESPQITNLHTELNYLDLFRIYCIFIDLGTLGLAGGSVVGGVWEQVYKVDHFQHIFLNVFS